MLAEFDLKTQFEIRAQRGQDKVNRGLKLLEKAPSECIGEIVEIKSPRPTGF